LFRPNLQDAFRQPCESWLNFAGFRVRIANYAHRFARSFTCPRIGRSALTWHGQTFAVTAAAITIDRLQTFQIALHVSAQIALDLDLVVRDRVNDLIQLLGRKIFGPDVWIDIRLLENALRSAKTDSVDIRQRYLDAFVCWNFNSE